MKKVEILSPAGSVESLQAAIAADCDAIYIGGNKFGARAYADNPDKDMLIQAMDYAHLYDKKLYLTVNTLLKNDEIKEELYDYLYKYYIYGIDAVIVQDMGVVHFIHKNFPDLPIHASTQMTLTMAEGANVLKDYGVTRFVPSRELNLKELKYIREKTDLEIEVFVHGALCYSFSGQCLMSSMFGGRSGNRGRCAQPCRMPYSLLGEDIKNTSILNNNKEKYIISPKDICTLDLIPSLIDSGIDSFKIEGRMKRPEYTAITTYTYRKYVDKYLELGRENYERYIKDYKKEYNQDKMNLLDIYNRGGFSQGYLNERNDRNMITLDKPNHSGVLVGAVSKVNKSHVWIGLKEDINKGDVLKIVGSEKNTSNFILESYSKDNNYEYTTGVGEKSGSIINTKYDRRVNLKEGDLVFRIRNNKLINNINDKLINKELKISIDGKVDVNVGEELKITLICGDIISKYAGHIVEKAKNQPMSSEKIKKQIMKTNDTNFIFNNLVINNKGQVFIPVSKINEARRKAIAKLENDLIAKFHRVADIEIEEVKKETREKVNTNNNKPGIHTLIHTEEQLYEVVNHSEVSAVYIDSDIASLREISKYCTYIKETGKKAYLYMPHIFRKISYDYFSSHLKEEKNILNDSNIDGYIIRNLEEYSFLTKHHNFNESNKEIITDHNLYVMNEEAKIMWKELGVSKLTAPLELNRSELLDLDGIYENIIVYGRIPLMVTAQCLVKTVSGGDNKHLNKPRDNYCCGNQLKNIQLVDRQNVEFPVIRNCRHCYSTIYNSLPLSLLKKSAKIIDMKTSNIRLDFTLETREETDQILKKFIQAYYYGYLSGEGLKDTTRGHFNRGIK